MADPYPALRRLREDDPVHWSDSLGGWVVTRYDDVLRTYLDVEHYSNEGRLAGTMAHLPPEDREMLPVFAEFYRAKGLVHADPPDHTRIRRLILKWGFTPVQVESLRPQVQRIVDDLIDDRLDQVSRQRLDVHLAGCEACRRLVDDLREIRRRSQVLPPHAPRPEVWARIARQLAAERPAKPRTFWTSGRVVLAMAAVMVLSVTASFVLLQPARPSSPSADPNQTASTAVHASQLNTVNRSKFKRII